MESESSEDYYSDEIDPEIEVSLYGLLHHHLDEDNYNTYQELNNDLKQDFNINSTLDYKRTQPSNDNCFKTNIRLNSKKTQVFHNNREKVSFEPKNKSEIECIQIDDSSEDSDVVIISDNEKSNKKSIKSKDKKKTKSNNKSNNKSIDILFANVNNLKDSSLLQMNKFYNEDIHDSEEEMEIFNNMSNDKNDWKISFNDVLLSNRKSNRYYRNRFICNNCSERGHQSRDCPLPKKIPTCYLCGNNGHKSERCKSILCSKCFSSSHRTANCNVLVNQLVCNQCGVRGHDDNQCTYNWRKYHMTTTTELEPILTDISVNERVSCYNCGAFDKHYGHECRSKTVHNFLHLIPPSPIMLDSSKLSKKGNCINGRASNLLHHSIHNGNIVSNQLRSPLSTSFDETLSEFNLSQNSITSTTSYNRGNKHIKWIYPETSSTSLMRNEVFEDRLTLNEFSVGSHISQNQIPLHFNSAQTHSHEEINNSMLERSERTPTKRSKRNKHKNNVERHELLKETNISSNEIKIKKKERKIRRRINRRLNKKFANIKNREKSKFLNNGRIESL